MGRCFTCKKCLVCVNLLSQLKNISLQAIDKVCRNNGGYQSCYDDVLKNT